MYPLLNQETIEEANAILTEGKIFKVKIDKGYGGNYAYLSIYGDDIDELLAQLESLGQRKDNKVVILKSGKNAHADINRVFAVIAQDLINQGGRVITTETNETIRG